jgi:hypothetical protein
MQGDRTILDTVFATNRNAIVDLHNLKRSPKSGHENNGKDQTPEDLSAPSSEVPVISDVLPIAPGATSGAAGGTLRRSFSRRGMRLGVHMSILDMGAHSAPDALKNKWIQTSRSHHPAKPSMSGARSPANAHVRFPLEDSSTEANVSPVKQTPGAASHDRVASRGWISSSTAEKLHKMIDQFELSHSPGFSKLVSHGRRHSSVKEYSRPATQAEELRRRRFSTSKQDDRLALSRAPADQ